MALVLTVPELDGMDAEQSCAAVADRAGKLLGELGHPTAVTATPGDSLAAQLDGQSTALPQVDHPLDDPADRVESRLIAGRGLLLAASGHIDPETPAIDRIGRMALTLLACRDDGGSWPADGSAEEELAARMARTDPQPLAIGLDPNDARRLFPDQDDLDAALRQTLYEGRCIALPPAVRPGARAPGTMTIRVRDITYPSLQLPSDGPRAVDALLRYWTSVVTTELEALVTPIGVDAILVQAHADLPMAAELASRRWPPSSLINLVRRWLRTVESGPRDLPAIIERAALVPRQAGPGDGTDADVLARHFPGLGPAFAEG